MRIACNNINNSGILINKDLLNKCIFKYNGMFGRALFKLYDLGYQSSPAIFDLYDFRSCLFDDFPDEKYLLRDNLSGKVDISDSNMIKYAIMKTSNQEFKEVLSIYLDILVAEKALNAFTLLLSRIKIPKKSSVIKLKSRLGVSGAVKNYNNLPFDVDAVRECIIVPDDEYLVTYNTSHVLVKKILERLGYSSDSYEEYKKSGKSFFISGVSQDDEIKLLSLIISGKINADGKFGKELVDDVNKYYNDFYTSHNQKVHCLNYEEVIFNSAIDERNNLIAKRREELSKYGFRDFYITNDSIIFAVKKNSDVSFDKPYFENNTLKLGIATLSHENKNEFSKINTLCGLCGEFIHESIVKENNWYTKGVPLSIKFGLFSGKRFRLSELSYYPIYNVFYSEKDCEVKPLLGNEIHIIVRDWNETLNQLGVSSVSQLYDLFLKAVDVDLPSPDIDRVKYEKLIADLTTALVCAECGVLEYKMQGSRYTWLTDDIFYKACVRAEELFHSYGF